jgi:diguanylate cyclase (GGDEF)-like protein
MVRATAIWNQDSVVELLTRELARTEREGGDLCVMLAGIDLPKTGFPQQQALMDSVLGEVAKRFAALLRAYDHVGRYGSHQLLIVVPGLSQTEVLPIAEELRQAVAQSPVEVAGTSLPLTVSVALSDGSRRNEPELFRELNGLLYRAQAEGGNRVEVTKALPTAPALPRPRRRIRLSLWVGVTLVAALGALAYFIPSTLCAPFLLSDVASSNELPPPLPADCQPTTERPSNATMEILDRQREARSLQLLGTITCKIASSGPKDRSVQIDQQWLDTIYINGAMQYKRNVLLAAPEKVQGGTLFTVEQCIMPWWSYVSQPQDRCWEQAEFWK